MKLWQAVQNVAVPPHRTIGKGIRVPLPDDPRWVESRRLIHFSHVGYRSVSIGGEATGVTVDLEGRHMVLVGNLPVRGWSAWRYSRAVRRHWVRSQSEQVLAKQRHAALKLLGQKEVA